MEALEQEIVGCERCPRLREYCASVASTKRRAYLDWKYWGRPVPGFGDENAFLYIVGLAPAAHGANRTGRMFTGDSSGDWLYRALFETGFANQSESTSCNDGLELRGSYIGAAARCAPPKNRPSPQELQNCQTYLQKELRSLSKLRVVLALGGIAMQAIWSVLKADHLTAGSRPDFCHGGEWSLDGLTLLSSYHPSRQNTNTRRLTWPMWISVFERARELGKD